MKYLLTYLRFLRSVINDGAQLQFLDGKGIQPIEKNLTHTLKANGYLLLYNVVEATMTTAIEDIHKAIRLDIQSDQNDLTLDRLNQGLFLRVLRRFKNGKDDDIRKARPEAGRWLIKYWLDDHEQAVAANKNPLASGNLDGRKIFEMAQLYGFDSYGREDAIKHQGLHAAKTKRNDLAHGKISFLDCGKDISLDELVRDGVGVLRCLRHHVSAVEGFINGRGYVMQTPASANL